jgi:MFS family permease
MVGGAAVAAASIAAYGSTTGVAALVGLRLLTGVGEAFFLVGAMAAASDMAPPTRRGEAMSLLSVGIYGGVALGPNLGENVLASAGFATVWPVAAAAAAIAAVGASGKETLVARRATAGAGTVLHRAALLPGLVLAASACSLAGFNALLALHARQVGLSGAGQVFALFAVVVLSVRIAGARIPDRLGPRRTARAALATTALGMVVIGAGSTPTALLAGTVLFALGQSLAFPGLAALAVGRVGPSERGAVFATMTAFLDLAFGMGAITLGALAGSIGLGEAFLVSAVIAAGGALALGGPERRGEPPPSPSLARAGSGVTHQHADQECRARRPDECPNKPPGALCDRTVEGVRRRWHALRSSRGLHSHPTGPRRGPGNRRRGGRLGRRR